MEKNHSKLISKQMNKFKIISEECIGCKACAMVAATNFEINDKNIAFVKIQPENIIMSILIQDVIMKPGHRIGRQT